MTVWQSTGTDSREDKQRSKRKLNHPQDFSILMSSFESFRLPENHPLSAPQRKLDFERRNISLREKRGELNMFCLHPMKALRATCRHTKYTSLVYCFSVFWILFIVWDLKAFSQHWVWIHFLLKDKLFMLLLSLRRNWQCKFRLDMSFWLFYVGCR